MAKPSQLSSIKPLRTFRYFSETFKQQKVEEIDKNITTVREISRTYQVSRSSVYLWIYKYSRMKKKGIKQVVEPLSDTKRIAHLEARIKELEQALGRKQMLLDFKDKMIDLAEEMYKVDIKKKLGS